jgi:SAM-dependent methyltransferase
MKLSPPDPVIAPGSKTERFWDHEAKAYEALHERGHSARSPLWMRMAIVLQLLGPRPGSVVDCGMGPGRLLAELERSGWLVSGIDISGEMVALARERLPGRSDRLLQGSIESMPFPSRRFDAAVCTGVLEYVEDIPRALGEVSRVLRPGGLFVVSMPNSRAIGTFWRHQVVYVAARALKARLPFGSPIPLPRPGRLSLPNLKRLLDAAGFEVERVEYMILLPRFLRAVFTVVGPHTARTVGRLGPRLGPFIGGHLVVAARNKPVSPSLQRSEERQRL